MYLEKTVKMKFRFLRYSIAGALLAGCAMTAEIASAKQCVYNHFGKSWIIAGVEWYKKGDIVVAYERNKSEPTIFLRSNSVKPTKSETLTAGQTSCSDDDFAERDVVIRVVGGKIARFVAAGATTVAGAATGALVVVTGCVAGIASAATGVGAPVGAALCSAGVSTGVSVGAKVGTALGTLIPDSKEIIFAGPLTSAYYANVGGSAFDAWVDQGDPLPPAVKSLGTIASHDFQHVRSECVAKAKAAGLRPVHYPIDIKNGSWMCGGAYPREMSVGVVLPATAAKSDFDKECESKAKSHGLEVGQVSEAFKLPGLQSFSYASCSLI